MLENSVGSLGSKRLIGILGGALVVTVLAVTAVALIGSRSVLGAGGGGLCTPTGSPVCNVKSHNAFVDFQSVSPDGCLFSDASVQAFQAVTRPGQGTGPLFFVNIFQFDSCAGTFVEEANNIDPASGMPIFNGSAQFSTLLNTASISGTAPMFDGSGIQVFISTVNVSWQAFGPTTTFIDSFHARTPGVFMTMTHSNGSTRNAEAQGVVTDVNSANLASPTLNALLQDATSGTLTIVKS